MGPKLQIADLPDRKRYSPDELAAMADEIGELERRADLFKSETADRLSLLKAELRGFADDSPADEPLILRGRIYELQISPKSNASRWRQKLAVWKALGGMKSLALWDVTMKAVKDALGESATNSLLVTERTGNRTIKAVLRNPAVQPKPHRAA